MTPFHSGQKASGGGQLWPQAKPQCPDVKRETACCLCTALLTAGSFSAIGAIIGPDCYIHLWQIKAEGRKVDTKTAYCEMESCWDIRGFRELRHWPIQCRSPCANQTGSRLKMPRLCFQRSGAISKITVCVVLLFKCLLKLNILRKTRDGGVFKKLNGVTENDFHTYNRCKCIKLMGMFGLDDNYGNFLQLDFNVGQSDHQTFLKVLG